MNENVGKGGSPHETDAAVDREAGHQMKIMLLSNLVTYTYNFRLEIIQAFLGEGHKVVVVADDDNEWQRKELAAMGVAFHDVPFHGKGKSIRQDIGLVRRYRSIIKRERPDIVFSFTIKPNLYGGFVCRRLKVPYIPMITGLGELEKPGRLQKLLVMMHKAVMPWASCIFFQNQPSIDFFKGKGIRFRRQELLPGSGINLDKFRYLDYPSESGGLNFAFIGRLTKAKGIEQYLDCAERIRRRGLNAAFFIAGKCDEEYEAKVRRLNEAGIVRYEGLLDDTRALLAKIHCIVLPTFHPEGISNVLLEAAATGRPAICTSRPGCREVVRAGVNGLHCEAHDSDALEKVILEFCAMPEETHRKMGLEGRRIAETAFDRSVVVESYLNALHEISGMQDA